jgi:hypothetical protein
MVPGHVSADFGPVQEARLREKKKLKLASLHAMANIKNWKLETEGQDFCQSPWT